MSGLFYQIVVTIWLSVHPVSITLPKIYYATSGDQCSEAADAVVAKLKRHARQPIKIEAYCEETDRREL